MLKLPQQAREDKKLRGQREEENEDQEVARVVSCVGRCKTRSRTEAEVFSLRKTRRLSRHSLSAVVPVSPFPFFSRATPSGPLHSNLCPRAASGRGREGGEAEGGESERCICRPSRLEVCCSAVARRGRSRMRARGRKSAPSYFQVVRAGVSRGGGEASRQQHVEQVKKFEVQEDLRTSPEWVLRLVVRLGARGDSTN